VRDLAETDRLSVSVRDDDVGELVGVGDAPRDAHELFLVTALEAAGRDLEVLPLDRAGDLGDGDAERLHLLGVEIDADPALESAGDLDLTHAVDGFEASAHRLVGEGRELDGAQRARREGEREDRLLVRVELEDDRFLDVVREVAAHEVDAGPDVLRGLVAVTLEVELDDDERDALEGLGRDSVHALDRIERLLEAARDLALHDLGARAGIDGLDDDDGDVDLRHVVDGELAEAEHAEDDEPEHHQGGEDRAPDGDPAQPAALDLPGVPGFTHAASLAAASVGPPLTRTRVPS